ncbi:MAG TPA: hypothetical protein VHG08_10945, partial [Longimicrobium sp.]|nr:hypothetical protein [Longimicrobium sp.]
KHRVHRAITGAEPRAFELRGTNWFPRPAPDGDGDAEAQWRADVQLLKRWHARLMAAVDALDADGLSKPSGGGHTVAEHLLGVAAHDVYHAGQIQLLKRLHAGG